MALYLVRKYLSTLLPLNRRRTTKFLSLQHRLIHLVLLLPHLFHLDYRLFKLNRRPRKITSKFNKCSPNFRQFRQWCRHNQRESSGDCGGV